MQRKKDGKIEPITPVQSPELCSLIDTKRTAIRGRSSGGYTPLASISLASISLASISLASSSASKTVFRECLEQLRNLEPGATCGRYTHTFELESPVYFSARIETPLLVLQGNDNEVVPPVQSWIVIDGAHFFDGEQYGWRTSETIKKAIEFEREWYEKAVVRVFVSK
ncbi:hypothetical protein P692DRAFT_201789484 [Suillus brevipes Sb2]|nr:hypothetical protein P692DRAFT_201789484 [Suillus brevipes Sb2]